MYSLQGLEVYPEHNYARVYTQDPYIQSVFQKLNVIHVADTYIDIPLNDELCRVGINMGLPLFYASPFWTSPHPLIEGKYKPMRHQLVTAAFLVLHPRCFILSECRTGKTGAVIVGFDYLQLRNIITGGVLVVTTATTMRSVWEANLTSALPGRSVHVVHGKDRKKNIEMPADWYVTNYDTVRLHKNEFLQAVKDGRISALVIDELTHCGNARSQRHKALYELAYARGMQYVVGLTGSPGVKPEPVYGMVRVINETSLPCRSFTSWMSHTTWQYGPQPYMRKPVDEAPAIIYKAMQPSLMFKKADVLDLPPVVFQDRTCSLARDQARILKELRQDMVASIDQELVSAPNAAALTSKLLQVALGFIIREDEVTDIPAPDRDSVLIEAVQESERKTVVFCMFKYRLKHLEWLLNSAGIPAARIDGGVTSTKRTEILRAFANDAEPRVLVAHPTTVGYGTELSAADTMIFDGPPILGDFSYAQSLERLSSVKQQANKIAVIRIHATPEERLLFDKLAKGQTAGKAIAALFQAMKEQTWTYEL